MSSVLVTGANGFVGRVLCAQLLESGSAVRVALRSKVGFDIAGCEVVSISDIDSGTDWLRAVTGMDAVIHVAARVHVMRDGASNPLEEFRRVNVAGTENLARQAARAGVRRFVYVSSIKVNGEQTAVSPFSEADQAAPQDPYGISKWEAEQVLHRIAAETGLEVAIVRPPLVYGQGVKGNFAQMLKVLEKGIPLPLASVKNLRSLIYVGNLVDALILCVTHPAAAGKTYLLCDGEDISTPDMLRLLGDALGHPARLFSCPLPLLKLAGRLTGKAHQIDRLLGSLQVDSGKIRRELGWAPPHTLQQGLRLTAAR